MNIADPDSAKPISMDGVSDFSIPSNQQLRPLELAQDMPSSEEKYIIRLLAELALGLATMHVVTTDKDTDGFSYELMIVTYGESCSGPIILTGIYFKNGREDSQGLTLTNDNNESVCNYSCRPTENIYFDQLVKFIESTINKQDQQDLEIDQDDWTPEQRQRYKQQLITNPTEVADLNGGQISAMPK